MRFLFNSINYLLKIEVIKKQLIMVQKKDHKVSALGKNVHHNKK